MAWEVEYTDEFEAWWDDLTEEEQESIDAAVEILEERGPALGRPLVDVVQQSRHQNMKELRPTSTIRILFAFDSEEDGHSLDWRRQARFLESLVRPNGSGRRRSVRRASNRHQQHERKKGVTNMAKAYKDLRDKVRSNPERAARVKTRRQAMEDALALAEIREKRELTQTDIAQVLKMSQANVSRIERQQNLYLSTLAEYVEALGGELKISAVFADEEVEIGVGRELSGQR